MNIVLMGFLGSLAAGMMTAVGAIPVLLGKTFSRRVNDTLLGFAAGAILTASLFCLTIPSVVTSRELYGADVVLTLISLVGRTICGQWASL